LQTTLAADAHLAEEQFLLEQQTLNNAVSNIPRRNSETNNFQNGKTEFKAKVDMSKKECIEAVPSHAYSVQF
jgi:Tfp pilus assembly PilM family ATPase